MYNLIVSKINWPLWANDSPRFCRLDILDRFLDGSIYNSLPYDFEQEVTHGDEYIPLHNRRPSVQFNLPRQVAVRCSRKLFAGRQRPHLVHENQELISAILSLIHEGFLDSRLLQAAEWGSVGSVAVVFKIRPGGDGIKRIIFETFKSKWCQPRFDMLGELKSLRVNYVVSGFSLLSAGYDKDTSGEDIEPGTQYWFIKDYTTKEELTYFPIEVTDWSPFDPSVKNMLKPQDDLTIVHNYDFVPAHWFVNLSGGEHPDGACTWEPAIPTSIHIDYTLSQLGRGLWYNASPQLVVQGKLLNYEMLDNGQLVIRGPQTHLQFDVSHKDANSGETEGGGDAHLLEMAGTGLRASLEYVETLRKYAFESVQMSRKDPDKMGSAPLSGRAMEALEEDFIDLFQELRTSYGEMGFLPLIKKSATAAKKENHHAFSNVELKKLDELRLQWPRPYRLSADELLQFSQALIELSTMPIVPGASKKGRSTAKSKLQTPAKGKTLMDMREARALLETFIDLTARENVVTVPQQEPIEDDRPGISPPTINET